ncbi:MAG: urease accessory protein UreD [Acidobacteriota bacterium]|nr:urease accessory protein UreD [Acidobacteriota bacterium]
MCAPTCPRTAAVNEHPPWKAFLDLEFLRKDGKVVLSRRRHGGPLYLQKPFYPEGDEVCHAYLLHPPSGLVGGDQLTIDVHVGDQAHTVITTPACGKYYRSSGRTSRLTQHLTVAADSCLEWLPQETLLFGGSLAEIRTVVDLHSSARFIGWDVVVRGRPLSGDHYDSGTLDQRFELNREGAPLLHERLHFTAGDPLLGHRWGLGGQPVTGLLVAYPADSALRDTVRDGLTESAMVGVTLVDRVLVLRVLSDGIEAARASLEPVLRAIREAITGCSFRDLRIWQT